MFVAMELSESRLDAIERAARERHTIGDRVTIELVLELRRLRAQVAQLEAGQ
jgi:hypothetical protein